ncbi:MAG: amino acid adenylation domain-containing protein [Rhizonema sp. NSF051]|nr:amino acid adenylation domain-containing protein [Rhizonema sp. NSF051]
MNDLSKQIDALSPKKRALFELLLKEQNERVLRSQTIPRRKENNFVPLSFAQRRLCFLDQLHPNSFLYNLPSAVHLKGWLNVSVFSQSLNEIVRRHEALRTTFTTVAGQLVQAIAPTLTLTFPVVDLQKLSELERETEVQQLTIAEAQQPFNLTQGPLLRATLLQLDEAEHIVLLTMHHIVSDGWSIGVFIQELAAVYEAFFSGKPSPLPELSIQYADFAVWQQQWLTGEVLEAQINYWKQQLAGAPPLLELPTDRPRPPVESFQGGSWLFQINPALTEKLNVLSQNSGATLFMTLEAAFAILLSRYSGQKDILIGSPVANRNRREIEPLIGFFVNTLVLRTNFKGNPTFGELLTRVQEMALGAYAHQDLPFEQLVEELQPQRSLSHAPLFQVIFVLQNTPMSALELPGLILSPLLNESRTAKCDLTLSMIETAQGIVGNLEYNTDLFEPSTISRMAGHLQTLLCGIVANPQQRLSELPLLTQAETALQAEWNDTRVEYPQHRCIHELFECQVESTPDAVAVVFESEQLTYQELNARANQLAHYLRSLGVGPEVLVGICVERSLFMVIGMLGILKAGSAYVPLDPTYPQERLAFILEDAQVPVLLTQGHLVEALPQHKAKVICLDADWQTIAQYSQQNLVTQVTTYNLAYVIYTSGSTGRPKGVQIPHSALSNFLQTMQQTPGLTEQDTLLAVTTYSFDIAALEIFLPIIVGACLVIVSREVASDGTRLWAKLTDSNATVMQATPPTWQLLLAAGWSGNHQLKILCGGETLPGHLAYQLRNRCASLWNMYGPTETTIWSATCSVKTDSNIVPIGHPIAHTQFYILDQHGQLVPVGVPGELHIGGDGLARGYLNRPELTAQKFIPNPMSDKPGAYLYKTEDLARYDSNGNIEFLGRIDHQVKIRGFRIELGEIEAVLAQHPAVRETVVLAQETKPGDKQLVAYVVNSNEQTSTTNQLRKFLKEQLPEYMVPSVFVFLEALPLTPNRKIDRNALPAPNTFSQSLEIDFLPPRDTLELQLVHIWEEVLNVHPVGVRDDFFKLGGHSFLAISLMARIQEKFGKNLPLATLLQNATVEHLASILRKHSDSFSWSTLIPIQPSGSKRPLFCIYPDGGTILWYTYLARHLGSEQPFYGLQSLSLDQEHKFHTQIEDIAAHYIEAIQTVQPQGPYQLLGWSFGGLVAFEMAQQLQVQNQQVSFLGLLDVAAVRMASEELQQPDDAAFLVKLYNEYIPLSLDHLRQLEPDERRLYIIEQVKQLNLIPPDFGLAQAQRLLQTIERNQRAVNTYKIQIYSEKVILFQASEGVAISSQDSTLGWRELTTEGVEIHWIPGNHRTIIQEPHVQVLAEHLRTCLEKLQANDGGK